LPQLFWSFGLGLRPEAYLAEVKIVSFEMMSLAKKGGAVELAL